MTRKSILVVDDAPEIIDLVAAILGEEYQVKAAINGEKALQIAAKAAPDLILLDIMMPVMDGFEVLARLKSDENTRDIPVIFLTGNSDEASETHALQQGGSDFISKPISPEVLKARVATQMLISEQRHSIEREKYAYQDLLNNMLPSQIIDRLNRGEEIADQLDDVGVMFADLVGFTRMAGSVSAPIVVREINKIFLAFDELVDRPGVEKVKTIGDCYMAVSNLDSTGPDAHVALVDFALEAIAKLQSMHPELVHPFELRVGIHCGPVVAGVLKGIRSGFDIWGDTVNIAQRFESAGEANRVHVSKTLVERLGDRFSYEERGNVELKGKGVMTSFLVSGVAARLE